MCSHAYLMRSDCNACPHSHTRTHARTHRCRIRFQSRSSRNSVHGYMYMSAANGRKTTKEQHASMVQNKKHTMPLHVPPATTPGWFLDSSLAAKKSSSFNLFNELDWRTGPHIPASY